MKKANFILKIFVFVFGFYSCNVLTKGTLTEEKIKNYLEAYKQLREKAPEILQNVNQNQGIETANEQFSNFENTIKNSGLADYAEFVKLNAQIGAVFSLMQAETGMDNLENMKDDRLIQLQEGIKTMQEQINNPDMPSESKEELKKALEQMLEAEKEVKDEWNKNKKWADLVMDKANKLKGIIVSENDIELVKKYEKEIMETYTGFPAPEISE